MNISHLFSDQLIHVDAGVTKSISDFPVFTKRCNCLFYQKNRRSFWHRLRYYDLYKLVLFIYFLSWVLVFFSRSLFSLALLRPLHELQKVRSLLPAFDW